MPEYPMPSQEIMEEPEVRDVLKRFKKKLRKVFNYFNGEESGVAWPSYLTSWASCVDP